MTGSIVLVGFSGGTCSTLSQPAEILTYALSRPAAADGAGARRYKMHVATATDQPLDRVGFFQLEPTIHLTDCPRPDLIFLTSMNADIETTLEENRRIIPWIASAYNGGAVIAAVCPSQALLAAAGLLSGKRSAVHWSLVQTFRRNWPDVEWHSNGIVVDEGGIITSCGGAAANDLALYAVHQLLGEDIAADCARWFASEMPRTSPNSPKKTFEAPALEDASMKSLQDWLHTHYSEDIKFSAIAKRFNMTERTFYRHFKRHFGETPRVYLQKLRVLSAQNFLESTQDTVDEISRKVGYADTLFFRKLFKRHADMTPGQYRERYKFRPLGATRINS